MMEEIRVSSEIAWDYRTPSGITVLLDVMQVLMPLNDNGCSLEYWDNDNFMRSKQAFQSFMPVVTRGVWQWAAGAVSCQIHFSCGAPALVLRSRAVWGKVALRLLRLARLCCQRSGCC